MDHGQEETQGGAALRKWVQAAPGRSFVRLADLLGVTTQSVYEWRRGITRPGRDNRERIEALTGIRQTVWMTEEERSAARSSAAILRRLKAARKAGARGSSAAHRP
jgi:hypothetical protein